MAEGILRVRYGIENVQSAGTSALVGYPADPIAQEVLAEEGIDIRDHRARQVDKDLLRRADLVLVMEKYHQNALQTIDPAVRGKVFLLGHWQNEQEIDDPYQRGREAFEKALVDLDSALSLWIEKIK